MDDGTENGRQNGHETPRCGALTRDGDECSNPPMVDRTRCRMHGGATPRGMASPHYRHGRRARVLPARLQERYEAAAADQDLLSIRQDVALLSALIDDKLEAWAESSQGPDWQQVFNQIDLIVSSFRVWDWTRSEAELRALAESVSERRAESQVVEEVRSLIDQRARLAAQEHRRLVDLHQVLTVEQVVTFASALAQIVREEVADVVAHQRVEERFSRLLSAPVRASG